MGKMVASVLEEDSDARIVGGIDLARLLFPHIRGRTRSMLRLTS